MRLLTKAEVAAAAKVSKRTVENWMRRGMLGYVKIGGIVRFPEDQFERDIRRLVLKPPGGS